MCNSVYGIGLHPVILCEIVVKLWFASRPFRLVREIRVRKPVMNVTEARRLRIAMDDGYELACVQVKRHNLGGGGVSLVACGAPAEPPRDRTYS